MTHNVSRRTLAKGAAWAAPAVVATTAIPAYAASPSPDTPLTCDQTRSAVAAQFDLAASNIPDMSGVVLRLWHMAADHMNGRSWAAVGAIRAQFESGADKIDNLSYWKWQLNVRNVDTAPVVNNTLGGSSYPRANGLGGPYLVPTVWPASGEWNTRTGAAEGNTPGLVDQPQNDRSSEFGSSFFTFDADGSRRVNNTQSTPNGTYSTYTLTQSFLNAGVKRELASTYGDLFSLSIYGGYQAPNRIYTAHNVRPVAVEPPTEQAVRAGIIGIVDEACFTEAYNLQKELWISDSRGLGGMVIKWAQWATGTVEDRIVGVNEVVWSNELGAFHSAGIGEGEGRTLMGKTSVREYFDPLPKGLLAGHNTTYGIQLRYRDGIA